MRYLGSKAKLVEIIADVLDRSGIEGETFADLFSGTGCVGDYFKDRYKIISNDFLFYSYVVNYAKLNNSDIPSFSMFKEKYNDDIFTWLNKQKYSPDDSYFFYKNYTPVGGRMYFTEANGIKIDGIRQEVESLYQDKIINLNEYYFLLASMVESITKISNTTGTYEAYLKFWDTRATKEFEILPLEIEKKEMIDEPQIYQEDTNHLVRHIDGDIAYIDPPYTVTQYVSAYHMFETLVRYDHPKIKGVGGKRGRAGQNSLYAQRTQAKKIFEDLFRQLNFKYILVSYSNQGLVPIDELCELASKFAVDGKVSVNTYSYQEYQNHRSSNKRNGKSLHEVIIHFEKDNNLNKSPLNYSGSKNTLLPNILKELPPVVGTFVDVMGGAFNVGANVQATEEVIYNEINPYVYGIINWILSTGREKVVSDVENVIAMYGLKKGDREAYNKLRDEYNRNPSPLYLYVLHMYSFQNIIRFNSSHKFNTPIGVAGYSDDIRERLLNFRTKSPKLTLMNKDYVDINWESFPENTVFYFDPPYYITSAAYNDGKRGLKGWTEEDEERLRCTLDDIDAHGYYFILSNVLRHKGKENTTLIDWIKRNKYRVIDIGKSGWRYSKNEVLIVNYSEI